MKWILRYLPGTRKMKICFGGSEAKLIGILDSNMVGDVDTRKSTSGHLVTHSGGAATCQSRLQNCVASSSTEA